MFCSGIHNHDQSIEDIGIKPMQYDLVMFIVPKSDYGIHPLVKIKVDEYILDAKSNFRIKQKLEEDDFNPETISTGKQLSNRRAYLRKKNQKELAKDTKGGFYQWVHENNKSFNEVNDHDFFILSHQLDKDDFILIVSTKSLLGNAVKECRQLTGFIAADTTHKIISCQLKLTTVATVVIEHHIADIACIVHANENSETFKIAFTEIKNAIKKCHDYDWKIKVIFDLSKDFI